MKSSLGNTDCFIKETYHIQGCPISLKTFTYYLNLTFQFLQIHHQSMAIRSARDKMYGFQSDKLPVIQYQEIITCTWSQLSIESISAMTFGFKLAGRWVVHLRNSLWLEESWFQWYGRYNFYFIFFRLVQEPFYAKYVSYQPELRQCVITLSNVMLSI